MAKLTYKKLLQDMAERTVRRFLADKCCVEAFSVKLKVELKIEHSDYISFETTFKFKGEQYLLGGAISRFGAYVSYIIVDGIMFPDSHFERFSF